MYQQLDNKYKDVFFQEKGQKYYKYNKELISVTTILKNYQNKFDEDYWSKYKAKQLNQSQQQVLYNWEIKRLMGNTLGSFIHSYIENYRIRKLINLELPKALLSLPSPRLLSLYKYKENLLVQANKFLQDFNKDNYICSELVVGNNLIAGQIDYLEKDRLIDFKADKEIKFNNSYQKMKGFLSHLDDCNWNKYCLQVSMYKLILELDGFIFSKPSLIIHFDRNKVDYTKYEIPYLKEECLKILNNMKQ